MALTVESIPQGPVQANTHIVTDTATGKIAVVDAGDCTDVFKEYLQGKQVEYILLSHGHFDHILGVPALKALTGAEICIHALDADCLSDEEKSLCAWECAGQQTPMTFCTHRDTQRAAYVMQILKTVCFSRAIRCSA